MVKSTCEVCGYQSQRGDIKKYHIVPQEVAREAGKLRVRKIALCNNCHKDKTPEWALKTVTAWKFE